MRLPIARERPLEDEKVDRSGVEVQRCMERTDTNRSKALPKKEVIRFWVRAQELGGEGKMETPVTIPNTEVKHFSGEDSERSQK